MTRYRGRSAESNTLSFSNLLFFSSHGAKPSSLMFLHPYFSGRGDFWLRAPLAQSWGAKVKTFCDEKIDSYIFQI